MHDLLQNLEWRAALSQLIVPVTLGDLRARVSSLPKSRRIAGLATSSVGHMVATPPGDFRSSVKAIRAAPRPKGRPFPSVDEVRRQVLDVTAARSESRTSVHPWVPAEVTAVSEEDWSALIDWYVVVDDYEETIAVLSIAPWPMLDDQHRQTFSREHTTARDVELSAFQRFLAENRCQVTPEGLLVSAIAGTAKELRSRPVRVGDAFAFSDAALAALPGGDLGDAERVPVVIDISASGRTAAKAAFYAAAARPLDPKRRADREIAEIAWSERDDEARGS